MGERLEALAYGDATNLISFAQPNYQCHPTLHLFSSTAQPYLL
jgi:hypothetical protein